MQSVTSEPMGLLTLNEVGFSHLVLRGSASFADIVPSLCLAQAFPDGGCGPSHESNLTPCAIVP